jgi:hypothetical protein
VSKQSDNIMLDAYNAALERQALILKALGCDDPTQASPELLRTVAHFLLARLGRELEAEGVQLTAKQIEADHRKLTRLKRRQVS